MAGAVRIQRAPGLRARIGYQYIRFYTLNGVLLYLGLPYEIATPWTSSDLTASDGTLNLQFVESNDVVYLCHPSYVLRKLSRLAPTNWTLSTTQPESGPFKPINNTSTTVYSDATTGAAVTLIASSSIFTPSHVALLFDLAQKDAGDAKSWKQGRPLLPAIAAIRWKELQGEQRRNDWRQQALSTPAAPSMTGIPAYSGNTRTLDTAIA